jgi:peroxiredoxin Q/BCP
MRRLTPGTPAPDFHWLSTARDALELHAYRGMPLLLAFFRYSGCRYCNLQLWSLVQQYPAWEASGLQVIVFFESPLAEVQAVAQRFAPPFALAADPDRVIYRRYQVKSSQWGTVVGILRRWRERRAVRRQHVLDGVPAGTGDRFQMPAQFLITPEGRIARAYYGRDLGDFLPMAEIATFTQQWGRTHKRA